MTAVSASSWPGGVGAFLRSGVVRSSSGRRREGGEGGPEPGGEGGKSPEKRLQVLTCAQVGSISLHRIGSFQVKVWGPSELPEIAIKAVNSHSLPHHLCSGGAEIPPSSGSFQARLRFPSELPEIGTEAANSRESPRKVARGGGGSAPVTHWCYWGWGRSRDREGPAPDWIPSQILRASTCLKVLENALNPGPEIGASAGTWNCWTHLGCARGGPPGPPQSVPAVAPALGAGWLRGSGIP